MKESVSIFLGGTCADSTWRETLIPMLKISYFNPVVSDWTPECQDEEIKQRKNCDFVLYVITPAMKGVYSIAEVVDDSNKRPNKTLFCVLNKADREAFDEGQIKSLDMVSKMVEDNGGTTFDTLKEISDYVNKKKPENIKENIKESVEERIIGLLKD